MIMVMVSMMRTGDNNHTLNRCIYKITYIYISIHPSIQSLCLFFYIYIHININIYTHLYTMKAIPKLIVVAIRGDESTTAVHLPG